MSGNAQSHLEVTAWPPVVVPLPTVPVFEVLSVSDPWIEIDYAGESWTDTRLPAELYLREAHDVDMRDVSALADFVGRYGSPGWWPWRELPDSWSVSEQESDRARRARIKRFGDLAKTIRARRYSYFDSVDGLNIANEIHVDEVRMYLALVRNLTLLWRWMCDDIGERDVAQAWSDSFVFTPPTTREKAGENLVDFVNSALARQTVRLELLDPHECGRRPSEGYGAPLLISTYEVMILQMYNHIVEQARYLVCANETCERLFVRQRSTDERTVSRPERVRFCSSECRAAQKQREYRRRKSQRRRVQP